MEDKTSKIEALKSGNALKRLRLMFRSPIFLLILLAVLTSIAYSNTFHVPFLFDDVDNISNNPYIKIKDFSLETLRPLFTHSLNHKRPVSLFSFALNYKIDGVKVVEFHVVNLLIHIINGFLLFFITKALLTLYEGGETECDKRRILYVSFFSTALWMLNPVQIFSVTYIVQRMNSLSAMFSLLAIVCYIRVRITFKSVISKSVIGLKQYLPLSFFGLSMFIFAVLGVASKQNAVLLPLLILLLDLYFIMDRRSPKNLLNSLRNPGVLLFVAFSLVALGVIVYYTITFNTGGVNPWKHVMSLYHGRTFTPFQRMITQPRVLLFYLSLIFYPDPDRLALLVDIPKSTGFLHPLSTILSMVAVGILLLFALVGSYKRSLRLFSFAILWFFVGHILESTIIPLELVYIHRNYLPSMFIFLPLVFALFSCGATHSSNASLHNYEMTLPCSKVNGFRCSFIVIPLISTIFIWTFWTYRYNEVWKTSIAFWKDNVEKFPALSRPHANYGVALYKGDFLKQAEHEYKCSLKIKPADARTLFNLGVVYEDEERYGKALECYSNALRLNPKFADAWCNQGNVLVDIDRLDDGLRCLYAAWELQPFDAVTNCRLGHALMEKGNSLGALFHLHRAVRSDPKYADPLVELGVFYTIVGKKKVAKEYFLRAKKLDPGNKLVNLYLSQ